VAFYASWCKGCRRLHPELTALAEEAAGQGGGGGSSSPLAGGKVKFVRVNYDRLRAVAAGAGATVLPFVAAFAPRGGNASGPPLLGWQAVASKPGATRANLIAMLSSGSALPPRGKKWAFPKASSSAGGIGGSAAPLLPELVDAAEAEAADRAREVEKLAAQASTAGLFERLAAMAGSGSPGGGSGARGARPPAALSVPPSSVPPPPAPSPRNQLARANPEQKRAFLSAYPGDYNPLAEPVAAAEVAPRLRGLVYLDSTGAALYSNTQVDQLAADLRENAFGNPHTGTASPPAALSSARIEEAREMVLEWFNADPGEFFFFRSLFSNFNLRCPPGAAAFFLLLTFSLSLSLSFSLTLVFPFSQESTPASSSPRPRPPSRRSARRSPGAAEAAAEATAAGTEAAAAPSSATSARTTTPCSESAGMPRPRARER
jgi:thiol-disulfide isomerase/thioredoxin